MSACQSCKPVAPFFFLAKVPFWASSSFFFLGVWSYRYAYDVPLVTLILKIYGFLHPTSSMNQGYTDYSYFIV